MLTPTHCVAGAAFAYLVCRDERISDVRLKAFLFSLGASLPDALTVGYLAHASFWLGVRFSLKMLPKFYHTATEVAHSVVVWAVLCLFFRIFFKDAQKFRWLVFGLLFHSLTDALSHGRGLSRLNYAWPLDIDLGILLGFWNSQGSLKGLWPGDAEICIVAFSLTVIAARELGRCLKDKQIFSYRT